MASRYKWEDRRDWRAAIKVFMKKHRMNQRECAQVMRIQGPVLCDYLAGRRNTTAPGRRGFIAFLEDWEDAGGWDQAWPGSVVGK